MSKKEKEKLEFRFYNIPPKEPAIALYGENWLRTYGHDAPNLHFHNLFEVGYCKEGRGNLLWAEQENIYENGTFSIIPANYPHNTISFGEELNYCEYIFFDMQMIVSELFPNNPDYQMEVLENVSQHVIIFSEQEHEHLAKLILMLLDEMKNKPSDYRVMGKLFLQAIVIEIIRIDRQQNAWKEHAEKKEHGAHILSVLTYVDQNYMNPIKAKDLAEVCSMSETHFRRKFQEEMNMAPMDYVNWIRIKHACDMMCKSDEPMEIIALKCGFTTVSTFNRNFNRFLYTSPYKWKQNTDSTEKKLLDFHISALKGW